MEPCKTLKEYLVAYVDGELSPDLHERVRTHLDGCDACRDECEALAKVAELYRTDAPAEVSAREWTRMSAVLEAAMDETALARAAVRRSEPMEAPRRAFNWFWPGVLVAAAAMVMVAFLTWSPLIRSNGTGDGNGGESPIATGGVTPVAFACMDCIETGPDYEAMVRLPTGGEDDVLIIDVDHIE